MKTNYKTAIILASLMFLAGCKNTPSACRACIGHDDSKPVAAPDVAKIKIIRGDTLIPKSATNVYFSEICGIDCSQQIRLDMPPAEALTFAEKLAGAPLAPIENGSPSAAGANTKLAWWPKAIEKGMSASSNKGDALNVFVVPGGDNAAVYIHSFSM